MTVPISTVSKNQFAVNLSMNSSGYYLTNNFLFTDILDVNVYYADANGVETKLNRTTDWAYSSYNRSITLIGNYSSKSSGTITIAREINENNLKQDIDLESGSAMTAAVLETAQDKTILIFQEIKETLNRVAKLPITSNGVTWPTPVANSWLYYDASKNLTTTSTPPSSLPVGSFPVQLVLAGGAAGNKASPASWTYDVYTLTSPSTKLNSIPIGADASTLSIGLLTASSGLTTIPAGSLTNTGKSNGQVILKAGSWFFLTNDFSTSGTQTYQVTSGTDVLSNSSGANTASFTISPSLSNTYTNAQLFQEASTVPTSGQFNSGFMRQPSGNTIPAKYGIVYRNSSGGLTLLHAFEMPDTGPCS